MRSVPGSLRRLRALLATAAVTAAALPALAVQPAAAGTQPASAAGGPAPALQPAPVGAQAVARRSYEIGAPGSGAGAQALAGAGRAAGFGPAVHAAAPVGPGVGPDTKLQDPPGTTFNDFYSTTAVATDPTGSSVSVLANHFFQDQGTPQMPSWYSSNGGGTFTYVQSMPVPTKSSYDAVIDPAAAYYRYQNTTTLNAVALGLKATACNPPSPVKKYTTQLFFAAANNGVWNSTGLPVDPTNNQPDKPQIAADPSGRVYVGYTTNGTDPCHPDPNQKVVVAYSDPGNPRTFSPVTVYGDFGNYFVTPTVAPDGTVYVVWEHSYYYTAAVHSYFPVYVDQILISRSVDKGLHYSSPPTVVASTTVGGQSLIGNWSNFSCTPPRTLSAAPSIAIDPVTNAVYVAFASNSEPAGLSGSSFATQRMHVYLTRSTDGGATWSLPGLIDTGNPNDAWEPVVAVVAPTTPSTVSTVGVAWYDRREDSAGNKLARVYYRQSQDGGLTFTAPVPVSSAASDPTVDPCYANGDYMGMAAANNTMLPVWTDARADSNANDNNVPRIYSAKITVNQAQSGATSPLPTGGEFHPVQPQRLLDTRDGSGFGLCLGAAGRSACLGKLGPNSTIDVQVGGVGASPVPTSASAVALNVTAVNPAGPSFLTVYPTFKFTPQGPDNLNPLPTASNLNFVAGQTIPNLVIGQLSGGVLSIYNYGGQLDVVADVVGYFSADPDQGDRFSGTSPLRVLDTRSGNGTAGLGGQPGPAGPIGPGGTFTLGLAGARVGSTTVPNDIDAVILNVTVTQPTASGYLTVWPGDQPQPLASNLNFRPGDTIPNLVIVKVGQNGTLKMFNYAGTTHVVADVMGWFRKDSSYSGLGFHPIVPDRYLDTRFGVGGIGGALGPGAVAGLAITGRPDKVTVPAAARAVIANVTAVRPTAPGFLTLYPGDVPLPTASNLNFGAGQIIPNLTAVSLSQSGPPGRISIYNYQGTTDVVLDVAGYFQ